MRRADVKKEILRSKRKDNWICQDIIDVIREKFVKVAKVRRPKEKNRERRGAIYSEQYPPLPPSHEGRSVSHGGQYHPLTTSH